MTTPAEDSAPRTYTVTQLAEILQLSPVAIRTNARTGKWPYLAFGPRTMRFTEAHLATILAASEATPPPSLTRMHRRRGEPPRYSRTAP